MEIDQGRNLFNRMFMHFVGISGKTSEIINHDDKSIAVVPGDIDNFLVGDEIFISDTDNDELGSCVVMSKDSDRLFLDRPINNVYPADTKIEKVITNMAADNLTDSATVNNPVVFVLKPPPRKNFLLSRINFSMELNGQPSDSNFGNISALGNGIVFKHKCDNSCALLTHWKKNSDMRLDTGGPDVAYVPKKGESSHGLGGRWTLSKVTAGLAMLNTDGDYVEISLQDDITGIVSFRMKGQGAVSRKL